MKKFNKIVEEICKENNISYRILSDNWVYVLEKDDKINYIVGYKFNLNKQGLSSVLDDKYAFYELLKGYNFPIIKHYLFFRDYKVQDVLGLFLKYNNVVVVKSNYGTTGEEVFYVDNKEDLLKKVDELLKVNFSISICPFYQIKAEYRVVVLDNEIKLLYGKRKPVVYGDGKKTVKELLLEFNYQYFSKINLDELDEIIPEYEEFHYNWQFNLSRGATIFEVKEDLLKEKLCKLAKNISEKIGLRFGSIDIIETINGEFLVMEANSGVMFDNYINLVDNGYNKAKEIYKEAILKMFD